jgi:hypothetical protein
MIKKKNIHIRKTWCWETDTKITTKEILKVNKRTNTVFALLQILSRVAIYNAKDVSLKV